MPLALADLTPDDTPLNSDVSSNMFPRYAEPNVSDDLARDAVVRSDSSVISAGIGADGKDLRDSQFSIDRVNPLSMSALGYAVANVVALRSREKMIRIEARRHIAPMTNVQSIRNRAVRHLPSETMHPLRFPSPFKQSVPIARAQRSLPQAAPIFVGLRSVVSHSLRKRPATRAPEWFSLNASHNGLSSAVLGQGRVSASTLPGPNILAKAA